MAEDKPILLVVEDDVDVADMLGAYFNVQGYQVVTVYGGEDALVACRSTRPDLIILDIRLPDIDGYEVARRLRSARRTEEIPIIFLTDKRSRADRMQGLEIGADDYITKPFDIQELRLRVRNALRRSSHGSLTNPVTNLPEGALVDERLVELLATEGWVILRVDLENLDYFRDAYGFVASDDVVRAISLMIQNAARELGNTTDFVGQLSLSRFILVTSQEMVEKLTERIHARLEQSLDYFYPVKDREAGVPSDQRLKVRLNQLKSGGEGFRDLESLKAALVV
jgi:DNA-binding response OmpR family regulator